MYISIFGWGDVRFLIRVWGWECGYIMLYFVWFIIWVITFIVDYWLIDSLA